MQTVVSSQPLFAGHEPVLCLRYPQSSGVAGSLQAKASVTVVWSKCAGGSWRPHGQGWRKVSSVENSVVLELEDYICLLFFIFFHHLFSSGKVSRELRKDSTF